MCPKLVTTSKGFGGYYQIILNKHHNCILNAINKIDSEYIVHELKLPDKFLAYFNFFKVKSILSQSQLNTVNNIISQMIKNDTQKQKKE